MKAFKKFMDVLAAVEKLILVVSTLLILVLTVGNVFSRKVIHQSWSFTEELVVAVFVLITLMAAALACREGELVSLTLITDRLPKSLKKAFYDFNYDFKHCIYLHFVPVWNGQGNHADGKRKENLRVKLAGVDFLVLCSHRGRVHDSAFPGILY